MSKIAKKPIQIKEGVTTVLEKNQLTITGSKGTQKIVIPEGINVKIENGNIFVSQKDKKDKKLKAMCGLTWANTRNIIVGLTTGFEKKLELVGVGYRAQAAGDSITLSLGFSHPVVVKAEGIQFSVGDNVITVAGTDKTLVGNTAAKIRGIRPPEPYKGKGIKYVGERIRRKAGKAAKAVGGAVK
jgi:large subunit ribosomal protein L6